MAEQIFPTKGNLIKAKRSLYQANLGYELMDRKRNILIREMVSLIDTAKSIRGSIEETYRNAYLALQHANIMLGVTEAIAKSIPIDNYVQLSYRSVMGVELPKITTVYPKKNLRMEYGNFQTSSEFDNAFICFNKAKALTITLAELENSIYRLANAIKKTQKRANALKNIIIPKFEGTVKYITNALEEKEREEFSRQKVIKKGKLKKQNKPIAN